MKTIFVLIFTVVVIGIVAGIYFVKFNNSSDIGKALKSLVIKNPQFIEIFNLNQPGDNRFSYLSPKYPQVFVNIAYSQDNQPDGEAQAWISQMILESTGKNAQININSRPTISGQEQYADADLNRIRQEMSSPKNSPQLNIVYLSSYAETPSFLGVTLHRDSIFIFKKTIINLTNDIAIIKRLEQSTLMHEWGHLLGLNHIDQPGCIMSNFLETYDNRNLTLDEIPLTHCWETDYDLEKLKKSL